MYMKVVLVYRNRGCKNILIPSQCLFTKKNSEISCVVVVAVSFPGFLVFLSLNQPTQPS
jgi:hypothetical protein